MGQTATHDLGWLADAKATPPKTVIDGRSPVVLREWLRTMLLIRRAEEHVAELVTAGDAKCPCHLAIGQEACAVGVASALKHTDRAFGAHRSHAHYLALGASVHALFAEVLGKATGCAGGMGGSMHLVAPEHGLLGTVPIVGATIPMAVGAALASRLDGSGAVGVAFFGDGATEEGVFHESLNLAATRKLPVLFVCENNLFSSHLHIMLRQPANSVARFAEAHRIATAVLDGNDVSLVAAATEQAVRRARAGDGPTFLELVTYRWRGHVGPSEDIDVGVQRNQDLKFWKRRDPIQRLADAMAAAGHITPADVAVLDNEAVARVNDAVRAAREAPYPSFESAEQYLYASRSGVR